MAHCGGPDLDGPAASASQAVWKPEQPKGNGDLPSGSWVLGLESVDVVAGGQNIERQSVFLKDVSVTRFLKDSGLR